MSQIAQNLTIPETKQQAQNKILGFKLLKTQQQM